MSQTLFNAFSEAVSAQRHRPALLDHPTGSVFTYDTLSRQVTRLVCFLQDRCDITPGDRVGLLMQNQVEFVVGFFALQALGAVVLPLNYKLSSEELRGITKDAGLTGLIASTAFEAEYSPLLPQLHWFLQVEPLAGSGENKRFCWNDMPDSAITEIPVFEADPDGLAVLIYTSGTTGKNKGVMLSHRNLLADARANIQVIEAVATDTFVTASPLFHVFGLTNIMLSALLSGARIVLIPKFHPKTLLEAITQHQVTFLAAVPTMYQMMLTLLPAQAYNLSSLRVCHSGAAPMPRAVFHQIEEYFGAPVQEGYGQSEASSIVTSNPLHGARKPGSIGKAIPGVTVEIVDEAGQVVPVEEIGELRVTGETVMLGYWNRPDITAKTLRDDWLYTSDLGYHDEDGYIFLVDRRDDLINVGGTKVYPREVEEVLYQHSDVQSCAVRAETSELYFQQVSAYVVLKDGTHLTTEDLQAFCRSHLAEYKVPQSLYFVDEIPKSATGKILRRQLAPPETFDSSPSQAR